MAATIDESHDELPKLRRREPLRIPNACQPCRSRKIKCDGGLPVCDRCKSRGRPCVYNRQVQPVSQRTKGKQTVRPKSSNRSYVPILPNPDLCSRGYCSETTPGSTIDTPVITLAAHPLTSEICSESETSTQYQEDDGAYCNAHGPFSNHIAATIDSKSGSVLFASANPVPFVDAPLFGDPKLDVSNEAPDSFTELPPRAYADRLVGIYWKHIHVGEPVLGREEFFRDYDAFYSGSETPLSIDHDLWLSILYIIFALAVQRQESMPPKARDDEANRYFEHAWTLARPERFLWDSGSLEHVQCLMLMNRYLHCTSNRQKTWMTAGLAMRIAQSVCCPTSEIMTTNNSSKDTRLRQQIWASCVGLDRCVSWSLGKTSTPYLIPLPNNTRLLRASASDQQANTSFLRKLELHEIGNRIQLAQTQARDGLATRLGISQLYQQDYQTTAIQLEEGLNKWEDDLPSDWKLSNVSSVVDKTARAERYFLHLRLLHTRIFLWRPMLVRFCSGQSRTDNSPATPNPDRPDHHLRECAAHCVKTAQIITSLIIETLDAYEPMGILPWWYRVYYLHIAGTMFLAAMLKPVIYTTEVSKSWDNLMSAFRKHEHLSSYVARCVYAFTMLSTRILQLRRPDSEVSTPVPVGQAEGDSGITGVLQDLGVNFDDFLLDMGDTLDNDCFIN